MEALNTENEGMEFLGIVPSEFNLNTLKDRSLDELVPKLEPYWISLFPEYSIYRYLNVDDGISNERRSRELLWYRPIILVNGYQSNRTTWNKFAQQLWDTGFRNIFALEPECFSINLESMFERFEKSISTILSFLSIFNSVVLIGHSLGGTLARYYVKHAQKANSSNVSLLITLATPHYGLPKYLKAFESFFRMIVNPQTVDLFSEENGIQIINKMHEKNEINITEINVQGSMKRLAGGDGTFKPEPVSEMINNVVHRHHFRINKSIKVFNLLKDYLCNEAQIFKIQLNVVDFSASMIINPINIYFIIKIDNCIEQRFPIQDDLEISSNSAFSMKPFTIFAGKFESFSQHKKITISLYRRKRLTSEKIIEESFLIQATNEEPIFDYHILSNQIVSLNFNSISYKIGREIFNSI